MWGCAGRKLADMDTQLAAVQLELTELQAKKAELTAQMMKVDAALASTYGRKVGNGSLCCLRCQ